MGFLTFTACFAFKFTRFQKKIYEKTQIIINRQKAASNWKYKGRLPEEPTISIHTGGEVDYAYAVQLGGDWILKQNYAESPCSGAHIWLESTPKSTLEITHRRPLSEDAVDSDALIEDIPAPTLREFFSEN